jgi:hypothetical protein
MANKPLSIVMNKQLYAFLVFCILGHSLSYAQDEPQFNPTNSDEFLAENSGFVKIEDFTVPRLILQLSYGDARARKIQIGEKARVYYQITSGNYVGSVTAENFPALVLWWLGYSKLGVSGGTSE